MKLLSQVLLSLGLVAVALYVWITQVPSAAGYLERFGLAERLGLEAAEPATQTAGRGGWGGGGPTSVVVAPVAEGKIDDRLEAIGDGRALHTVTLRSDVTGVIVEIAVSGGSFVEQGDVVLRLDDQARQIAVERARLNLQSATEDAERLSRLSDSGAVTEVSLREARLAVQTAELALREAEYELEQRTLRAPLSGWMGVLDLAVGDRLNSQDVVATLTDRSKILIDFQVPERAVAFIEDGMPITVRPLSLPGVELQGTVRAIDNIVDRESRTLRVQGEVDNSGDRLRAGMAFTVTMSFPGESLPSVDPLAVQWSDEGSFVWAVREGKAVRVPVTIRQRNSDSVIVAADLSPGELVVTEGVQNLRPGAEVDVPDGPVAESGDTAARQG